MSQITRNGISGSGGAPIETLTGNAGGAVGPDGAFNINILGGTDVTVTGNPGTNTLTIDVDANIADTYNADIGSAIPALNILTIAGGSNITTTGAGSTITIDLDNTVSISGSFTAGTGLQVTTGDANILGGNVNIGTAAPANPYNISIEDSVAGNIGISIQNTSNNVAAAAVLQLIDEIGAQDPQINYVINGGATWSTGIDNSDSDAFKITTGSSPSAGTEVFSATTGGTVTMNGGPVNIGTNVATNNINIGTGAASRTITIGNNAGTTSLNLDMGTGDYTLASATGTIISALDSGEVTKPLQPAFLAFQTGSQLNVTGNGTVATVNFPTVIFDQNSDYDGTNTFTAPVTGRYQFNVSVLLTSVAGGTRGSLRFVTSNRTILSNELNYDAIRVVSISGCSLSQGVVTDLDMGDTAIIQVFLSGIGADTADIGTSGTNVHFSGFLVA